MNVPSRHHGQKLTTDQSSRFISMLHLKWPVVNKHHHLSCTPTAFSAIFGWFKRPERCLEECWNSENVPAVISLYNKWCCTPNISVSSRHELKTPEIKHDNQKNTHELNTLFTHPKSPSPPLLYYLIPRIIWG